jgi:mitochondrial import inner membrane translocase subunit TIM50
MCPPRGCCTFLLPCNPPLLCASSTSPSGPYVGPQLRTLVIDLPGVIMYSEWSRDKGWRYYKRPGVEDFLKTANQLGWEVVVYTPSSQMLGDPILDKIDPQRQLVSFRLYKDQTQYVSTGILGGGKHVCDLAKLNRDLSRCLFLSADPNTYSFQPDNAIKLRKWEGEADTTLLDLLPFLEMIVRTNAPDTRVIVKSYDGKDLVDEFKERMRALKQQKQQQQQGRGGRLGFR